ncbi:aromatic amino acid hydroxylase [Piscirickettsia salmonis]|uniref:Phenylalanine-4-hydroxylase n=1 Tax=Piscirickettsia salmonis TaxID=1238 RepID=A0A9Q6LNP3_PISSA|nr:phenylalanine 4-monooxygenase [Piscirickettsia salmonis]ALA23677.1 biopterin-dependent aromatic amino acid hydroxylase family protein [Piscirickettsia salmonis]APS44116.1 aromatic amino acid hydroxylase [Piscirickettsia salmonis]APS47477.1 aromatic amino acid hydroxylase [Piscirickettsia salmonis]APS51088.1 aromatic amino acid hydroxylase [Piscirickettsia salmonis]APS54296.1 aromatic amino acid hydroxylase [Piscirickettsia salmonis]
MAKDKENNSDFLSAYEKGALAGNDPRCVPITLDTRMLIGKKFPELEYSVEQHNTWQTLFKRQIKILENRASEDFIKGITALGLPADHLPSVHKINEKLHTFNDWQVGYSPGLLAGAQFIAALAKRVIPSTNYIREPHELDYTPAPDMFHEIFGHMPLITNPYFSEFFQDFGKASLNADEKTALKLERFYWFTVEFGLIQETAGTRIYGAGILSSYNETLHCLSDQVEKKPFKPTDLANQDYDVWHMQPLLFVIESYEQLKTEFHDWAKYELKIL